MVTIEEIKKFIDDIDNDAFEVFEIGAYRKDSKINLFVTYRGEGMDANVYNETYDEIVYFTEDYFLYKQNECSIDELIKTIEDGIKLYLNV